MEPAHNSRKMYTIILGVVMVALAGFFLMRKPAAIPPPTEPGQWKKNFAQALPLYKGNRAEEAEALMASSLDQARSEAGGTPEFAEYLVRYGATIYIQKKYEEMRAPAKEAETLINSLPPNRKPPASFIFHDYCNLVGSYYFSYDYKNAQTYIEKAQAILPRCSGISQEDQHWLADIAKLNVDGLERMGIKVSGQSK